MSAAVVTDDHREYVSWRWVDKAQRTWTCLVRYQREGLLYEHWISGELLDVGPDNKAAAPTPEG